MSRVRALTIAGSDPSGGAGLQADLAVFAAFGVHGEAVVSAVTVQNARGVSDVRAVDADLVRRQLDAVLEGGGPRAAKTGLLPTADVVRAVADAFASRREVPLVVDPIAVAGSGARLVQPAAERAVRELLLPLAALIAPNADEARAATGIDVVDAASAAEAAARLVDAGARAALVKGGHVPGDVVTDVLVERGRAPVEFRRPRVSTVRRVHGTGCALSAAVAAGLARGATLEQAVRAAGDFVRAAVAAAWSDGPGAATLDFAAGAAAAR